MACPICPTCRRRMPVKRNSGMPRKPGKIAWKNARLRHNGQGCRQCDSLDYTLGPFGYGYYALENQAGIDKTGYCAKCREVMARSAMTWVETDEFPHGAWPSELSQTDRECILEEFSLAHA